MFDYVKMNLTIMYNYNKLIKVFKQVKEINTHIKNYLQQKCHKFLLIYGTQQVDLIEEHSGTVVTTDYDEQEGRYRMKLDKGIKI